MMTPFTEYFREISLTLKKFSIVVFLQRNENAVMANNSAINSTDVKTTRNSKLKTLVGSVGTNLQTTIYTINCLQMKSG